MMHRQRGIAILTAVATAALVATLAVWIAWRQQLWFAQVENQIDLVEARGVALAAIDLARLTLRDDIRRNQTDHLQEPWNVPIPAIPVERGQAGGRLVDLQGRYNLNNLVQNGKAVKEEVEACGRLFEEVGLSAELVNALVDWMDADAQATYPGGAEDTDYLNLPRPYRAANQPLTNLQSLALVRGFDADTVAQLAPFVAVLPGRQPINVNFAEPEVMAAVVPGMTVAEARAMVSDRASRPFESREAFIKQLPERLRADVRSDMIDVQSRYFLNEVEVRFGRVTSRYVAELERSGEGMPRIVWFRRN
ncbi:type II secretion system minor pseudopilin GspK [Chitinolyticbacter meiyuanensis]|uniref:type II secretion system minor pseudopilin GspK n=1 Tax=Chitinolyticbacter meiyuanensis TaxID=682798 RepID=UPI0011E59E6B|nr:type II secretion system minor pseudopilin GspK [Chitinolyticbacter meiyuanensis]